MGDGMAAAGHAPRVRRPARQGAGVPRRARDGVGRPRAGPGTCLREPPSLEDCIAAAGGVQKQYDGQVGTVVDPTTGQTRVVPRVSNPAAKADVMNLSLGSPTPFPSHLEAMQDAARNGTIIVVATGNDGSPNPNFPAGFVAQNGVRGMAIVAVHIPAENPAWSIEVWDEAPELVP